MAAKETRHGVALSSLDDELFPGAGVAKRALLDYLDGIADRFVPVLRDRPLSVIRTTGDEPFMQKNLPAYAPDWIDTVSLWAEASHRDVRYALCNDARTLIWFGNQRAVEYHPTLGTTAALDRPTHLVLDLDPPPGAGFEAGVAAARLVHAALDDVGLHGAVKSSGAKGVHVFVPVVASTSAEDAAAATRALAARAAALDPDVATTAFLKEDRGGRVFVDATRAGGATVVAAYSPRARPGVPVSCPLDWDELTGFSPADVTVANALARFGPADPWAAWMPEPQRVPAALVEEGRAIPAPRVAAMHEGKRRRRRASPEIPPKV